MEQGIAVGGGRVGPEFPDPFEGWGETLVVCVAGLREDAGDALGVFGGDQEADWRTVVEDVDGEFVEFERLGESGDGVGDVDEGVLVFLRGRARGVAEPRVVGGDDVELVGDEGDQVAEGVGA